jgi:hypothetical protein
MKLAWPDGHQFAFTIVDDTDRATVSNVKPIYDLLAGLGMRTTKTAWMFPGQGRAVCGGSTCEEREYRDWLLGLQRQGFEVGFHNAAPCTSTREITALGLAKFQETFGPTEVLFCNHTCCRENIYWGVNRLSGWRRKVYNWVTLGKRRDISRGHFEGDPLFWGDLCQQQVRYVRNFVFDELDGLSICPEQPYHDPAKPFVNFWFTSADGNNLNCFLKNFTEDKLKLLQETGGLCIAYVHFAYGFMQNGIVNTEFQKRMEFLSSLNGWFAPASHVLDYLRRGAGVSERTISPERLARVERKWLWEKMFKGTT